MIISGVDFSQSPCGRRAHAARKWFAENGPPDLQPLPLGYGEREAVRGTNLGRHILKWYARSLAGRKYDFQEHPPLAAYVSGVLWEAELQEGGFVKLPNYPPEQLRDLKKRFPPRMLKGMSPGAHWLPPKVHAQAIEQLRRLSSVPGHHFMRE